MRESMLKRLLSYLLACKLVKLIFHGDCFRHVFWRHEITSTLWVKFQFPQFGVIHLRYLVDGFVEVNTLYGLVDNAMSNGKDGLVGVFLHDFVKEVIGSFQ